MIGVLVVGAPGVGKTSLLDELAARGFETVGDSARDIIAERKRIGSTPRPPPLEFAEEIYRRDCGRYAEAAGHAGLVFFERGVPDALGMLQALRPLPAGDLAARMAAFAYHDVAFILPPWETIFAQDCERDQTFADAVRIHAAVGRWYAQCGFHLVEVPRGGIAERADFVLRALSA